MKFRLYLPNPLPVRSLPNQHRMVHAGKEGDEFSQQSHSKGQEEIKVDRTEEEKEDQEDKTTLVSQRLFFLDARLPGWYRFFHLSATTILQTTLNQERKSEQVSARLPPKCS